VTLILALGNNDQVIQISDRRLSANGKSVDEESNKSGVLNCLNSRLAFGYTGLAECGGFTTQEWLLKALHNPGEPDFTIGEILERLKLDATDTFRTDPFLRAVPQNHKKLAVMFSGYINLNGTWKQGCAVLSNYHDFERNIALDIAEQEFQINYTSAKGDELNPTLIQRVGSWRAISESDVSELRGMLESGIPSSGIIGKANQQFRSWAENPASGGAIGKQLTSIIVPKDPVVPVKSSYSSDRVKWETYLPSMVFLTPTQHMTLDNISVKPVDKSTAPMSVPKVNKNAPCPCGSKKKYKNCHGRID